jgi:hypothetical protein
MLHNILAPWRCPCYTIIDSCSKQVLPCGFHASLCLSCMFYSLTDACSFTIRGCVQCFVLILLHYSCLLCRPIKTQQYGATGGSIPSSYSQAPAAAPSAYSSINNSSNTAAAAAATNGYSSGITGSSMNGSSSGLGAYGAGLTPSKWGPPTSTSYTPSFAAAAAAPAQYQQQQQQQQQLYQPQQQQYGHYSPAAARDTGNSSSSYGGHDNGLPDSLGSIMQPQPPTGGSSAVKYGRTR